MYPKVKDWLETLPSWKQRLFKFLDFFGQAEFGYRTLGFNDWAKTH